MSSAIAACLASLVNGGKAAGWQAALGGAGQAVTTRTMRLLVLAAAVFYVGTYDPHSHSTVQIVGGSNDPHYSLAYRLTLLTLIGELLTSEAVSFVNILYAAAGLVSSVRVAATVGLFWQVLVAR